MVEDVNTRPLGLSQLLAPLGLKRFFAEHWQQRPLRLALPPDIFQNILAAVGPLEIPRMVPLAARGCQAWLNNRYVAHSVFTVDAAEAQEFYDAGATLYFLDVPLPSLTNAVADSLGAPRDRVLASLFLTPPNAGAAPHFDKNENFTVQLTGRKRWHVGDAPALKNAPEGHICGRPLGAPLDELRAQVVDPPRSWIELAAGSLLYVPRGVVHGTEAGEASWSLNLSYTRLMWVELICEELKYELAKLPEWRESVAGVGTGSDKEAQRMNPVPGLIAQLQKILEQDIAVKFAPPRSDKTT